MDAWSFTPPPHLPSFPRAETGAEEDDDEEKQWKLREGWRERERGGAAQ